jgi:hypothetical protein
MNARPLEPILTDKPFLPHQRLFTFVKICCRKLPVFFGIEM